MRQRLWCHMSERKSEIASSYDCIAERYAEEFCDDSHTSPSIASCWISLLSVSETVARFVTSAVVQDTLPAT